MASIKAALPTEVNHELAWQSPLLRPEKRPISVLGFVPYPLGSAPSQRFRIEQWLPHLNAEGINVRLIPFANAVLMDCLRQPGRLLGKGTALLRAFLQSAVRALTARHHDVILIHRAICIAGPPILERLLSLTRCPVIYDFDDAIWMLHTAAANRRFGWLKFPGKTATICRLSDHIVVGNRYLQDWARTHNQAVSLIPSSVDTDRFRPQRNGPRSDRIIVGWTGSSTSQTHLELFAPMLQELCAWRDVEFRVHSDREPILPGVPFVWRPWSAETEVEELNAFDVGIMPMPDDPWARGKCSMKALLYMALGLPTVCSAVGTNCEVIRNGENGLLVRTQEEWLNALIALIDNPNLRSRLGAAGRQTVEDHYSSKRCAARFAEVVREVVAQRRRTR